MDSHLKASYDELHRALGDLVRQWAWLESGVHNLIFDLASVKSANFYDDAEVGNFYAVVASNIDLRTSISIVRALAFELRNEASIFDKLEPLLNEIGGDLRNKRNRFVHDQWLVSSPTHIVRFQLGTKLSKEPGSGRQSMQLTRRESFSSVKEIEATAERVHEVRLLINDFCEELQDAYRQKFQQ